MLLGCLQDIHLSSVIGSTKVLPQQAPVPPALLPRPQSRSTSSWFDGFDLWKRVKKNAWEHMNLKQQNWSTKRWCSTIAGSEPWFILISTCNLSLPFVDFKASAPGKTCCNWSEHFCQIFVSMILHLTCTVSRHFFPTHLDSSSVKSSNLFRGLNFREVSWWQDADAAGLNAVDVELLDGSVSSNRFGLGEPLVREMEPGDMVKIYWNMWKYLSRYKDVKIQIYVKEVYLNIFEHVPYMMYVNINEIRYDYGFKKSRLESESFKLDCKYLLSTLTLDTFFDTPSQAANSLRRQECRCQCCRYCCWLTAIGRSARNCAWKRDLLGALAYEEGTAFFATGTNLADYHQWGRFVCISTGTCEEVATLFTASGFSGNASGWSISSDVAKLACNKLTALLAQFGSGKTTSFIEFQHATRPSEPHGAATTTATTSQASALR